MTSSTALPRPARVLTIAGSDSGGGAGIQADLKTFAALGCYGMSALTALTAQNTQGVSAIHAVPPAFLAAQLDAVLDDIGADAIKIGMLHSAQVVHTVADALQRHALLPDACGAQGVPIVLDPVMVSATGAPLIEPDAMQALRTLLLGRATVITPNLDEAALLLGQPVRNQAELLPAAQALRALGAQAVLLKGGHLSGDEVCDLLLTADDQALWMHAPRVPTRHLHGAGCTLSSAIAAHLALGLPLAQAVDAARQWTQAAIAHGVSLHIGHGTGPLNHGHAPRPMALRHPA